MFSHPNTLIQQSAASLCTCRFESKGHNTWATEEQCGQFEKFQDKFHSSGFCLLFCSLLFSLHLYKPLHYYKPIFLVKRKSMLALQGIRRLRTRPILALHNWRTKNDLQTYQELNFTKCGTIFSLIKLQWVCRRMIFGSVHPYGLIFLGRGGTSWSTICNVKIKFLSFLQSSRRKK